MPNQHSPKKPTVHVIGPSIAYIPLSRGQYSCVELDDVWHLEKSSWNAIPRKEGRYYAVANMRIDGKRKLVFMHRFLLGMVFGDNRTADHSNIESLDNHRKGNLREATPAQQNANTGRKKSNSSGYKGVSKHWGGLYVAHIRIDGKKIFLGSSDKDPAVAHQLYAEAAIAYHGEFARTE